MPCLVQMLLLLFKQTSCKVSTGQHGMCAMLHDMLFHQIHIKMLSRCTGTVTSETGLRHKASGTVSHSAFHKLSTGNSVGPGHSMIHAHYPAGEVTTITDTMPLSTWSAVSWSTVPSLALCSTQHLQVHGYNQFAIVLC